jgi:hypothetical protein
MLKNFILISVIISLGLSADIGVTKILKPAGLTNTGVCCPKAQLSNYDGGEQNFTVHFMIKTTGDAEIYTDTKSEHLWGYETKNIEFTQWLAFEGVFVSKCSLALAGDINPDNDVYTTMTKVKSLIPGEWILYDTVPSGERRKKVKDGGCMVDGSRMGEHYLYVLKGNKTDEFYLYDVISSTWQTMSPVPCSPEAANKYPKKGACMIRFEDVIYLAKGNNTREFWRYHIPTDSWTLMAEIPAGASGKALKQGSSLAEGKIANDKYIFLIKGNSTREFYAYDPDLNTWVEKTQTPYVEKESKGKIKKGSCLTSDGEDVYLLKDKMNELWRYDCELDTWFPKLSIPYYGIAMRKAKVKDGAAVVYTKGNQGQDYIYALKGGGTEFWCYSVELDDWMELTGIPRPPSNKKAKKGTALVEIGDVIFGLKGSNTRELFVYTKNDTVFPFFGVTTENQLNQQGNSVELPFNKFPDTGLENLTIYNAAGRKLRIAGTQKDVWQGLKSGIYFITYLKNKEYNFRKIVITR